MGWWKVSSEDVITSRRGGQGEAEAPAEAVAMLDVTGPKLPLDLLVDNVRFAPISVVRRWV